MNNDPRGTIVRQGNALRIDNAFVEDSSCTNNSNGTILISYSMPEAGQMVSIQTLQLNINRNTVIINSFGQSVGLCRIQPGMWINAVFSSRMTRSIPPQSNAFMIVVRSRIQETSVTTDRIADVDACNGFIYTGNRGDINSQIRFSVPNTTPITDRAGRPISIHSLRPGQMVRITHANFMTASIPPQTTAYRIQLI